jgi:hypothetical protein
VSSSLNSQYSGVSIIREIGVSAFDILYIVGCIEALLITHNKLE